jgi:hypothetical protein
MEFANVKLVMKDHIVKLKHAAKDVMEEDFVIMVNAFVNLDIKANFVKMPLWTFLLFR